jgi:iron-sulfur cluster insertion protein
MVMENVQTLTAENVHKGPALIISESAASQLTSVLQQRGLQGYGLRVFVRGMGCSGLMYGLSFDNAPEATDFKVESNGVTLYLDPASSEYMWGSQIDFVETPQGGAFSINNPNQAASTCSSGGCSGCG